MSSMNTIFGKTAVMLFGIMSLLNPFSRADFLGVNYGDNQVVKINENTGASVMVGSAGVGALNSLAINSSGMVYSTSASKLMTINPNTGAGTIVATTNANITGLAFSSEDLLYGIKNGGFSDELVTVNTSTGAVSLVGTTSFWGLQSLEFSPEGTLYSWDVGSGYLSSGHGLVTIDPSTGVSTAVSSTVGTINIQTLAFGSNGQLYGAGLNRLYTIDTDTGAATLVGTGSYSDIRGMVLLPVPEPSTLALLGMGVISLFAWIRRWGKARRILFFLIMLLVSIVGMVQAATMDLVPVGDPGNNGELSGIGAGGAGYNRICGAVSYSYSIGKYEVTAGQYTEFLNAVGGVDQYSLYNTAMSSTSYGSGISRSGAGTSANPYTYSVAANFANRPANYVTYWDALRFSNWLQNGQPTGVQGPGTTETGSYTLNGYNGFGGGGITRTANANWVLPNEDEWYKAAYYKGGGIDAGYWDYPTRSNTPPGQDMADVSGNNANYYTAPFVQPIDSGIYTTRVGEFQNSVGPYGTFDQGGNVMEWNESAIQDVGSTKYFRVKRGGGLLQMFSGNLPANMRDYDYPGNTYCCSGFRIGYVPEPSTIALLLTATLGGLLLWRRWR